MAGPDTPRPDITGSLLNERESFPWSNCGAVAVDSSASATFSNQIVNAVWAEQGNGIATTDLAGATYLYYLERF